LVKTIEKVREKYDSDGFLKALYEGDAYAVVIDEIVNYNWNTKEFNTFFKNLKDNLKIISNYK